MHAEKPHKKNYWTISVCCFALICISFLFSCQKSSNCLTPKVVTLNAGMYYRMLDTNLVFKDTLLVNSNIIFGTKRNYFINLKQRSKFNISLAQNIDSVTLYFQSDSATFAMQTIDSIQLVYTRTPHYISTACGYETFFKIQHIQYSQNIIDTILINDNDVTNDVNKEHLKIVIQK